MRDNDQFGRSDFSTRSRGSNRTEAFEVRRCLCPHICLSLNKCQPDPDHKFLFGIVVSLPGLAKKNGLMTKGLVYERDATTSDQIEHSSRCNEP